MDKRDGVYYLVRRDRSDRGARRYDDGFVTDSAAVHKGLVNNNGKYKRNGRGKGAVSKFKLLNLLD